MADGSAGHDEDKQGAEQIIEALVDLGVPRGEAWDAVRRGDPEGAVFHAVLLQARLQRTVSPAAVEAEGGMSVEQIAETMIAFGLPAPTAHEPTFTPGEAAVLVELQGLQEVWPPELRTQISRVYGRMLARIASVEVQGFRHYATPQIRETAVDVASELRAVRATFEQLLPLADPMLIGVHRRWVEHELAQAAVGDAEARAGVTPLPGSADVAFLFCDLKDFTAYVEREGDAAAITAIDRFFDVVTRERGDRGRIVKSLGDGVMLAYDDPLEAVQAGARVIAAMRSEGGPRVHASVYRGIAIAREGDYFGSSVNLAARLLGLGRRDELLTTAAVVEACGDACRWEPIGEHRLRGVERPLAVYRLASDSE
jgi:adenylate cyclase